MNWRHVAFIIASVILIVILAQVWVTTYVKPAMEIQRAANTQSPTLPIPPKAAQVVISHYTIEEVDAYRFDIHYKVTNTGGRPARNIRIVVAPWKKIPTPDATPEPGSEDPPPLDPNSPLTRVTKIDTLTELKPQEAVDRRLSFDRPNGEADPLPPRIQYKETFEVEFTAD